MPDPTQKLSNQERSASVTRLAWAAEEGQLDNIECPICHQPSISVWFTQPVDGVYRTWFICTKCSFHSRAQLLGKPSFYAEDRRRADLENRDKSILEQAVFKMPPR